MNLSYPTPEWHSRRSILLRGFLSAFVSAVVAGTAVVAPAAILLVPSKFPTIDAAVKAAKPGDTVLVAPGKYVELVQTALSGTAAAPIIIDGQNGATIRQAHLRHQYVHLRNFTITGNTTMYSSMVYMDHGAHHCIVSNNVIDIAGSGRIYGFQWKSPRFAPFGSGEPASDNLVISNTVKRGLGYVLMSVTGDRNVIIGNRLLDTPQGDFFNIWGRSNLIIGNFCSNLPFASGLGNHPDFIQTFGNFGMGSMGHVIENNVVAKIAGGQLTQLEGALVPEIRDWTFRNNLFVDIALQASCTIPGIAYYNNTFVRCNYDNGGHALNFGSRSYLPGGTPSGAGGTNYAHNARVINNVFIDCGDSSMSRGWYAMIDTLTNVVADFNYVSKAGFQPVRADSLQRAVGSAGGWNSFAWWEPNGINGGDPGFVNLEGRNFTLRSTSLLIGAGTPLSFVTRDFAGTVRPSLRGWSIGAFEAPSDGGSTEPIPRPGIVKNFRVLSP